MTAGHDNILIKDAVNKVIPVRSYRDFNVYRW